MGISGSQQKHERQATTQLVGEECFSKDEKGNKSVERKKQKKVVYGIAQGVLIVLIG